MGPAAQPHSLIFHHIPKTAGTSFRTVLYNLFGDENCIQLREIEFFSLEQTRSALGGLSSPRLLCGHIPVRYVPQEWRSSAVTFVRDPIERVLSLFRFMREQPLDVRKHVGLDEDFTLREFLDCRHSDVTSQVANGMCRFLAREYSGWAIDGEDEAYRPSVLTLYSAIESLDEMAVGVCERMQESLRYLSALWGLPAPLTVPEENLSRRSFMDALPDEIAEIASRNGLDIALYRRAVARLERALRVPPAAIGPLVSPMTLAPMQNYRIGTLPARDGFNTVELIEPDARLSWLSKGARARLDFFVEGPVTGLSLRVYRGTHDYPVETATFKLNGEQAPVAWHCGDDHWGTVFVGPFQPNSGVNTLDIVLPSQDPSAAPPSLDPRELTFAVSVVRALSS